MLCAVYARKSSDDSDRTEEARSTTRQIERATAYARHRPGWNALIAALEPRPPFGMVIVSELSRIGRDTVRTPAAVLQLEEAGVEVRSATRRSRWRMNRPRS